MGSASAGSYTDAAKRLAGRSVYAIGSGIVAGSRLVAKGVSALTTDTSDKEPVRFLKFAHLELGAGAAGLSCGAGGERLPVLLIGLATGFQVWRLDGANPAELVSRRDGPAKLLEALPEPRPSDCSAAEDALRGDRPLLAVVPAPETPASLPAAAGGSGQKQPPPQQQHSLLLYSLRSHGYVRTLSFGGEVLAVQASGRVVVVALRGQLQAFDACTLHHTFSCLTYTPPAPLPLAQASSGTRSRQQRQQQFVTDGLVSSAASDGSQHQHHQQAAAAGSPRAGAAQAAAAAGLAPFALGPRWLAYAADTPVPQASGQAVAQRLPLARRDSAGSSGGGGRSASGALDGEGAQLGSSPSAAARANGLTKAAVADAALQAAARGGQQLKAGISAVGSASFKYLSGQYQTWRQGQQQQRDVDAQEADAAVAGTVVVRDAASRLVVAHFRAHTSPLAALRFSPSGTLLATASVAGHSINLFRIVPPAPGAEGAEGLGGGTGHAVYVYRLYRGVTPAAIRDIAIAPDAAWVAASSGRGTTHLFHTPAAAPGARQPAAAAPATAPQQAGAGGEAGVVGQPPKTLAVGRARKPGLLSGSVAGAATSAARNLYGSQHSDAAPIAAAFLAAAPGSPSAAPGSASSASSSLLVVTPDGLLTRHLLRAPSPQDPPGGAGAAVAADARGSGTPGGGAALGLDGQQDAAAAAAAAAAVLEEADRWDVARAGSWPEREELLPAAAASQEAAAPAAGAADAPTAEQQQVWVAQAECGALAAPGGAAAPLWQDSQFRFYELQMQQLQRQPQPPAVVAPASAPAEPPLHQPRADGGAEALAVQMDAACLLGGGAGAAVWLETVPVRAVQQQQ